MLTRLLSLLACTVLAAFVCVALEIEPAWITAIDRQYGQDAGNRIRDWQSLMQSAQTLSEDEKLQIVNDFFNRLEFVDDMTRWGVADYWATPVEFLIKNGGDCEDFAIAKYFSLINLGVPEDKLRITYVKALQYDQAHMVLTYFSSLRATPLVLDNLNPQILPATERDDLLPVYSFNGTGLWIAKSIGGGKQLGNSDRLGLWRDLLDRMQAIAVTPHAR